MRDTPQEHHTSLSIEEGDLCFADGRDLMASSKSELQALADKLAISGDQHGEEQGFGKHHSTAETRM